MIEIFKEKKGFTLIELLVVIAIIGLLTSVILVSFGPSRAKARDAQRQSDVHQVNLAMELCYGDTICGGAKDKYIDTIEGDAVGQSIGNFFTIPSDPGSHVYKWTEGTDQYYCFYVQLEAEVNTWFCASNRGVYKKAYAGPPTNDDCCGMDVN